MMIYTDGGCRGNPGLGAWAYIRLDGEDVLRRSEGTAETTNNRMELTAVIRALEEIPDPTTPVTVVTDSQYVKNGITTWIHGWINKGWKTANKKPVKNQDLWKRLYDLDQERSVEWRWVRGHSGDRWNEECDALLNRTMDEFLK